MSFVIDHQSKKDLELFEENIENQSVFSFFNKTQTKGGRARLIEIMKTPSSSKYELVERRDAIKFFLDKDIYLEFKSNHLDFIEHYLNQNTPILKSNFIDFCYQRVSNWIKPSNHFYIVSTGVNQIIILLRTLSEGLAPIKLEEAPEKVREDINLIYLILNNQAIKNFYQGKNLSFWGVLKADIIFRKKFITQLNLIIKIVYNFDVFQSTAKVSKSSNLTFAEYIESEKPQFKIDSLFHPFVVNAVSNDISINENQNLVFLTGANMAGKSTFLKSVGLAIYLAHLGFPVPAKRMATSIYKGLITTINLADNINKGFSHFFNEVNRIKETALLIKERRKVLVIFDELFRGTNVKDAYDGSLEVITAFSKIKESSFFISTHITEVSHELKGENMQFASFNSKLVNELPTYTYKLENGVSEERMGMYILKKEKITELLASVNSI
jgi:DNA mismatch repair protein MutS